MATTTMAGMMVPMIRVVSPLILGAYHGQIDVHHSVPLNKGTKSVTEIGPHCGAIYGLRAEAENRSGAAK